MDDDRKKLADDAQAAFDVVCKDWHQNGPIPRTACIEWMRATNARLTRLELGWAQELPTKPRRHSVRIERVLREGRAAAGLPTDDTEPKPR